MNENGESPFELSKNGALVNREALREIAKKWDTLTEGKKRKMIDMLPELPALILEMKKEE
ncbi:MAG: hypothetical protein WCX27_02450 [Candidatus Paceibacterota bacterium]|jgi:hypothetical protein